MNSLQAFCVVIWCYPASWWGVWYQHLYKKHELKCCDICTEFTTLKQSSLLSFCRSDVLACPLFAIYSSNTTNYAIVITMMLWYCHNVHPCMCNIWYFNLKFLKNTFQDWSPDQHQSIFIFLKCSTLCGQSVCTTVDICCVQMDLFGTGKLHNNLPVSKMVDEAPGWRYL